ncbi:MAG: hypothetical protein NZ988_05675 [Thaumarchaeota archaeon]|nr:hypothetical protein [Candidatus Calditenuaceae archaeon]MDW8187511.1 hypothetical protein [Nitrososphaerota archaeon]
MTDFVNDKEFVVPGQPLSDEVNRAGRHTYVQGGKVYSAVSGTARLAGQKIDVIPAKGPYKPREGDRVVGIVVDVKPSYYELDLGWGVLGILRVKQKKGGGTRQALMVGDVIYTAVGFAGVKGVMLRSGKDVVKVQRGILVRMSPARVPRLIVRNRELQETIERETGCKLYVGLNGLIALVGQSSVKEYAAVAAINLVESEPMLEGLKEKVTGLIRRQLWEEVSAV